MPWMLPKVDEAAAFRADSVPFERSDLVLFWQRLRVLLLAAVAVGAGVLAARWVPCPLHPDLWTLNAPLLVVGLTAGGLVDAWLRVRRRSTGLLLPMMLDATAIAFGLIVLQLPFQIVPFLYAALTAAILFPAGQALWIWCYDALLAVVVVASPPLPQWLGAPPTGTQLAAAEWMVTGTFGLLCLAETLLLSGAIRRFAQARQARLAYESRHKNEFLAGVSHALRTPLTSVVGFGQLIEQEWADQLPAPAGAMLAELNQQADVMRGMVDNLVIRTHDDAGELTLSAEPTDLRLIASEVIRDTAWLYPHKVIRLDGDPLAVAWADPVRTRQLVHNLVSNALQHGGDQIVLEVRSGTQATLRVTDDGAGPVTCGGALRPHLEPFEKTSTAVGSPTLGLGLPVSQRLAELMGGTLTHQHTPGLCIFAITLPSCS